MKKLIFFLLIILSISALAQERSKFLYAEFADKSVTLWPFYKPFGGNFDPALTVGYGFDYRQKESSAIFQDFQLIAYKTKVIGQGITLSSTFGYRYSHSSGLFGEAGVGLGASLFFSSREGFTPNEDGLYTSSNPLHICAVLPLNLRFGYTISNLLFYLNYCYMPVAPYTEMLPVMPTSKLGFGIRFNL